MIHARGLTKTFRARQGDVAAVRGVDLDVEAGEIVGFLGPNGAGKTTTQKMLCTLLDPTAGTASVAGCDLLADPVAVRRRIGYVAQNGCTEPEAQVGEELVDQGRLYGLGAATARERGERLLEQLDLRGVWSRRTKTLSGGQRRRLDIAMGLIHEPPLVFLDEPTSGLDPQARANLWEHVRALRDERGVTVFLTTHYLEEADALCDRILVIDRGEIVAAGTPEELKRRISGDAVRLTFAGEEPAALAAEALQALTGELHVEGVSVSVTLASAAEELPGVLRALEQSEADLAGIEVHRPTLDDVFLSLTGRALRDEEAVAA